MDSHVLAECYFPAAVKVLPQLKYKVNKSVHKENILDIDFDYSDLSQGLSLR